MTTRAQWYAVGAILAVLFGVIGIGAALTSEGGLVGPGTRAPDFRAVDVTTLDTMGLDDYQGEVMLLNVWATWCKPCEQEMPSIQRLHQALGPSGLKVVAVSIDKASSRHVLDWVRERNLTFDILHDQAGRIERIYQTTGVPESYIINRDGIIVKRVIGAFEWDHPAQLATFRRLLGLETKPES